MAAKKRSTKRASAKTPLADGGKGDGRGSDGRFRKGWKGGNGNPQWKKLAALRAVVHEAITPADIRKVLGELRTIALGGEGIPRSDQIAAAKVLFERVLGKVQTPIAPIEMPEVKSAADLPAAYAVVMGRAARGDCTVEELSEWVKMLDGKRTAFGEKAMRFELDELRQLIESGGPSR